MRAESLLWLARIWRKGLRLWQCRFLFCVSFRRPGREHQQRHYETYFLAVPICTVATAVQAMCQYYGTVTVRHSNSHCHCISHTVTNMYGSHICTSHVPVLRYSYCTPFEFSLSLYQSTLLPICTVATVVQVMCQYCGTVTVRDSNSHCHCNGPHCYQYVR
jgi:hypothetical protein